MRFGEVCEGTVEVLHCFRGDDETSEMQFAGHRGLQVINHARTLLMNVNGSARPAATFFMEEYIPPDFEAQELSSSLQDVYNVLFGSNPDNAFLNFRARQYTYVLHSTEFAQYVTNLDPRVTYLNDRSIVDASQTALIEPLNLLAIADLFEIGTVEATPSVPQMLPSWQLEVLAALYVRTIHEKSGRVLDTVVTIIDDLTNVIPMAGQANYGVRVQASPTLAVGAKWRITKPVFPDADLTQLVADLETVEASLNRLFGVAEPYRTFKELWNKHALLSYRLSGALLAFVYRAEEARTGNG